MDGLDISSFDSVEQRPSPPLGYMGGAKYPPASAAAPSFGGGDLPASTTTVNLAQVCNGYSYLCNGSQRWSQGHRYVPLLPPLPHLTPPMLLLPPLPHLTPPEPPSDLLLTSH